MKIPQLQLLSKTELENSKQLDNYVNSHPSVLTDFAILLGGRYKNATDTEAGYKAYYECKNCGKYYEDAAGLIEITNIDEWKAQGGNGYIAKLEKQTDPTDPTSPQTGDTSNMALWVMLLALSSMGLCDCLRKTMQ